MERAIFFLVGHNPESLVPLAMFLSDLGIDSQRMSIVEAETTFERADAVLVDIDDTDDGLAAAQRMAEFHRCLVATISSVPSDPDGLKHFQKPISVADVQLLLERVGARAPGC